VAHNRRLFGHANAPEHLLHLLQGPLIDEEALVLAVVEAIKNLCIDDRENCEALVELRALEMITLPAKIYKGEVMRVMCTEAFEYLLGRGTRKRTSLSPSCTE